MSAVFNSLLLQKQFDQKGYVVISSLLDNDDIDALSKLFEKYKEEYTGGPFYTSHFSQNEIHKNEVHEIISALVFRKASSFLDHFCPLFGNFMIKNPDHTFTMDLHADWAYVEESKFSSAAIWIPLVDVNAENGCLGVIEGSHTITNTIRGPQIRQSTRDHETKWAKKYGKLLPIKAGDAVVYNHALLHYSLPNRTNLVRPALNLTVVPEAASWLHYCQPGNSKEIEMYEVKNSDFYINYNHFQKPQSDTRIKTISPDVVKYIEPKMKWFLRDRLLEKIRRLI